MGTSGSHAQPVGVTLTEQVSSASCRLKKSLLSPGAPPLRQNLPGSLSQTVRNIQDISS